MSFSPVRGRSSRARVAVDEVAVALLDVQADERAAVVERHLRDVADPHARDLDRLALAGRHGLRVVELDVDAKRLGLGEREAQALLVEDVRRRRSPRAR